MTNSYREELNEKSDDAFREIIVSCRSLSKYESNTIKSALPQVSFLFLFDAFLPTII